MGQESAAIQKRLAKQAKLDARGGEAASQLFPDAVQEPQEIVPVLVTLRANSQQAKHRLHHLHDSTKNLKLETLNGKALTQPAAGEQSTEPHDGK